MKRLIEMMRSPRRDAAADAAIAATLRETRAELEKAVVEHKRATERADEQMARSVEIAQDALRLREEG